MLFFALRKQDSASGSFKQQFPWNLHSVSVVHFALNDANWRISSISRGFGLLGFCLPRLLDSCTSATSRTFWIYRTVSTRFNFCWRSYCNVRLLAEDQVRLFHFFKLEQKFSRLAFLPLSRHAVRRHRIQAYYELANFSCHNAAEFCIFNLFSLLFTVTCLRLVALTQTVADQTCAFATFANFLLPFCVVLICLFDRCFFYLTAVADFIYSHYCLSLLLACFC